MGKAGMGLRGQPGYQSMLLQAGPTECNDLGVGEAREHQDSLALRGTECIPLCVPGNESGQARGGGVAIPTGGNLG